MEGDTELLGREKAVPIVVRHVEDADYGVRVQAGLAEHLQSGVALKASAKICLAKKEKRKKLTTHTMTIENKISGMDFL